MYSITIFYRQLCCIFTFPLEGAGGEGISVARANRVPLPTTHTTLRLQGGGEEATATPQDSLERKVSGRATTS